MSSTMEAPIACSLGSEDLRARLERIANLGRRHLRSTREDGLHIHLCYAPEAAAELHEIVGLDRQCCSFLLLHMDQTPAGVDLTITAPASAGEFAPMLFEHFAVAPATLSRARVDSCQLARPEKAS